MNWKNVYSHQENTCSHLVSNFWEHPNKIDFVEVLSETFLHTLTMDTLFFIEVKKKYVIITK